MPPPPPTPPHPTTHHPPPLHPQSPAMPRSVLSVSALRRGLNEVVAASLLGSILSNQLLVLGEPLLLGLLRGLIGSSDIRNQLLVLGEPLCCWACCACCCDFGTGCWCWVRCCWVRYCRWVCCCCWVCCCDVGTGCWCWVSGWPVPDHARRALPCPAGTCFFVGGIKYKEQRFRWGLRARLMREGWGCSWGGGRVGLLSAVSHGWPGPWQYGRRPLQPPAQTP